MTASLKKTLFIVITAYILSLLIAAYAQKITRQLTNQTAINHPSWPAHGTITRNNSAQITSETNTLLYVGRVIRSKTHQPPPSCLNNRCQAVNANEAMAKITSSDTPLIIHRINNRSTEKTEFALLASKTNKPSPSKPAIKKSHSPSLGKSNVSSTQNPQTAVTTTPLTTKTSLLLHANSLQTEIQTRPSRMKQAAATRQSKPLILEQELEQLLLDFQAAYSHGNLALLFNLFEQNIRSNATDDQATIKKSYKKLFDITQTRRMILGNMHWQKHSTNALGKGTFRLLLREKGRSVNQSLSGDITIEVEKKSSNLMITQIQYNYN